MRLALMFVVTTAGVLGLAGSVRAQSAPRHVYRPDVKPDRVPTPEEWVAEHPPPMPKAPDWYHTRFHDHLNRGGQILFPVPPPDPVNNMTSISDENRIAWGMAQRYFFYYEAPYQLGTDFHSVTIGVPGVRFGGTSEKK